MIAEQDWKLKTFKYGLSSLLFVLCRNGFNDLVFFCFTVVASIALSFVQSFQGGGKKIFHVQP
jgi:hypothetical protein